MVVDYNEIPVKASELSSIGSDISKLVSDAYLAVDELKSTWGGKRYNTLIQDFNNIVDSLNEINEITTVEIPNRLKEVADNYAKVDTGSCAPAVSIASKSLVNAITSADESVLSYEESVAASTRSDVKTKFTTVKENLANYKSKIQAIVWEGEAADSCKSRFDNLANTIEAQFDVIDKAFENTMRQASEDLAAAEKANH